MMRWIVGAGLFLCATSTWAVNSVCVQRTWSNSQQARNAWVCAPDSRPTATTRAPMVLVLHGNTTTADPARYFRDFRLIHACWPEAVVVYFNAYVDPTKPADQRKTWQSALGQVDSVVPPGGGTPIAVTDKDVTFVDQFSRQLASEYNVDSSRVYGTGFSGGSYFLGLLWKASVTLARPPFRALAFVAAQPDDAMINASVKVPVHMATSPYDVSVLYKDKQKPMIELMQSALGIVNAPALPPQLDATSPPFAETVYMLRGSANIDLQIHLHGEGHAWPLAAQAGYNCGRESVLVTDFLKSH